MIERASFSGIVLFCLRKKSKSLPSQYSNTVQNEFVSISNTSNNLTIPKRKNIFFYIYIFIYTNLRLCSKCLCILYSLSACLI